MLGGRGHQPLIFGIPEGDATVPHGRRRFEIQALLTLAVGIVVGFTTACGPSQSPPEEAPRSVPHSQIASGDIPMSIRLVSPAFSDGETIPLQYTGDGEDVSPPLSWSNVPFATRALALICDDPDAPSREPWVHWVIYHLPGDLTALPPGVEPVELPPVPAGAAQGQNSWTSGQTVGYRGPAPPPGHGIHHYHFRIYALDDELNLPPGADVQALHDVMEGHILDVGELTGIYQR